MSPGWIGVDLDGTLARHTGSHALEHIGEPIPLMLERVKEWIQLGKTVKIFSARADGGYSTNLIQDWTQFHLGVRLEVTNKKDFGMVELWDDRCVQVIPNTGLRADEKHD